MEGFRRRVRSLWRGFRSQRWRGARASGAEWCRKSTLIRCLSGAVTPDAGSIVINDRRYAALTPKEAIDCGVAVIYQNLSLIPTLTVTENVFLGDELTRWGFVRRHAQRQRVVNLLHALLGAAEIEPDAPVGSLPIAARQLVEIAKALHRARAKLLILDEPTAALTETEKQILFNRLRNLRDQGLHIIYITHRLGEVFEIADRVTVLRDGKVVLGGQRMASVEPAALVTAIAGGSVSVPVRENSITGAPVLSLEGLTGTRFGPIDLELGAGEIVGLFGALGSGRTELLETIMGYRKAASGRVLVGGSHVLDAGHPPRHWRRGSHLSRRTGCDKAFLANSTHATTFCCQVMAPSLRWASDILSWNARCSLRRPT